MFGSLEAITLKTCTSDAVADGTPREESSVLHQSFLLTYANPSKSFRQMGHETGIVT